MSKCQPKLSEMPWNVKQQIVDDIQDSWDKLSLRQCSKPFRSHVDNSPIHFKGLHLTLTFAKITVRLDVSEGRSLEKIFKLHGNGVLMENTQMNWSSIRSGGDYRKAAVEKLLGVFTMFPKARIGELCFKMDPTIQLDFLIPMFVLPPPVVYPNRLYEQDRQVIFEEMLRIGTRIPTESLFWDIHLNQERVLKVLELCEPTTLATISCEMVRFVPYSPPLPSMLEFDRIVETEQWKQAKKVDIKEGKCSASFEKWKHFDSVWLSLKGPSEKCKTILETFLNRPSFEYCELYTRNLFDMDGVDEYLNQLDKRPEPDRAFHKISIVSPINRNIRFYAIISQGYVFLEKM